MGVTTRGTVLKGCSAKKVESHCLKGSITSPTAASTGDQVFKYQAYGRPFSFKPLQEKWQYPHPQLLSPTHYTGQGTDDNACIWDWSVLGVEGVGTVVSFVDQQGLLCADIPRGDWRAKLVTTYQLSRLISAGISKGILDNPTSLLGLVPIRHPWSFYNAHFQSQHHPYPIKLGRLRPCLLMKQPPRATRTATCHGLSWAYFSRHPHSKRL